MLITLKQYDCTFSVDLGHDDVSLDEALEAFGGLLKSAGFSSATIEEWLDPAADWSDDGTDAIPTPDEG